MAPRNPNEAAYNWEDPQSYQGVRMSGTYELPWSLLVASTFTAQQGEYYNRVVQVRDALNTLVNVTVEGQAGRYDCFTPDLGELAFLADEQAPHPFYTRGFILHESNRADDLIERAYRHDNAAIHLLVKGATDAIVARGRVVDRVDAPSTPAMEAIGGTGDTLTGLLAALCAAGHDLVPAASLAARANRLCGALARPTPASPVSELIAAIPRALADLGLPAIPA